jgi:hypothetical protein
MKSKKIRSIFVIGILLCLSTLSNGQVKKEHIGIWKFEAPTAPAGFTSGIYEVRKDTVFTQFTSENYRFPSEWAKSNYDTLSFLVNINGDDVHCILITENDTSMKGNAVWSSGETVLTLIKQNKK